MTPAQGAAVIVHRNAADGPQVLILRRTPSGPSSENEPSDLGDWTWTPPSGSCLPGEPVGLCAQRELLEETGLVLPLRLAQAGSPHWRVFMAQAKCDARVILSDEHDRFEWVAVKEAIRRCRPAEVADQIRQALMSDAAHP
jgi:8-oxo-dGTP pyrophosphatase MutT (NUDIX family)